MAKVSKKLSTFVLFFLGLHLLGRVGYRTADLGMFLEQKWQPEKSSTVAGSQQKWGPENVSRVIISEGVETKLQASMAACLLVLNDVARLKEWLAYHYTILPLSSVIIGIDPKTKPNAVQSMYTLSDHYSKLGVNITIWQYDTYIPEAGGMRNFTSRGGPRKKGWRQAHDERQRYLYVECMEEHKRQGKQWVILTDTDELLSFNFPHKDEDPTFYDPFLKWKPKHHIDAERNHTRPIRQQLLFRKNMTVAGFLESHAHEITPRACIRIAGLFFGGDESTPEQVKQGISEEFYPFVQNASSVRFRKHTAVRWGLFSKAMINVQRARGISQRRNFQTVHNPSLAECGRNGALTSGQDYISAVFRVNHYLGSFEAFAERSRDRRFGNAALRDLYMRKHRDQAGEKGYSNETNNDIVYWVDQFVHKVGSDNIDFIRELLP